MKRLSLLKKIALGSGVVASVTPIALMATSCAIEDITCDYVDFNGILFNGTYNAYRGKQSFKRLLFGSKKVNNGNYILFYGSNMFPNACKFFSGDPAIRSRNAWFNNYSEATPEGRFDESPFFYGIQKTVGKTYTNFGIFNVIDFWDCKVYDNKGHRIYISDKENNRIDIISPWAKWTDEIINQTKIYNKSENLPKEERYEWDEKSVSKSDYIRNDASAVEFRTFVHTGLQVYPVTKDRTKSFDVSDNNTSCKMLIFKNGVLQTESKEKKEDIFDMPTDTNAWYEIIKKYFGPEEK